MTPSVVLPKIVVIYQWFLPDFPKKPYISTFVPISKPVGQEDDFVHLAIES